jgi:hypothetical protein
MGWQLGALGAVVGAVIAVGLLPMKTTAIKIDGPVNAAQYIDTYVWAISLGIIVLVVVAFSAAIVWVVRRIIRLYKSTPLGSVIRSRASTPVETRLKSQDWRQLALLGQKRKSAVAN